ncbi:ATP-dependent Clp protease adapter ClpS [Luteococcus peritonei]|uniref:ATP-dependent Clp protease adapter protein ClpS n=1 Tax=Luteococcus peritonei TaxID=88874 RepID=A0ABW4RW51_9ACTN
MTTPATPETTPAGGTAVADRVEEDVETSKPWVCLVWDDPVNLMSYVTHVFVTYFNYPREKAEQMMLTVHNEGKCAVSSGGREEMERDVNAMHGFGLWATMERAS